MNFTVSTPDLVSAISTVIRAVPSKSAQPILETILIEAGADGLVLTGSDGSVSIRTVIPALILEEGSGCFPGRFLNELVRKLPDTQATFTQDGERVQIRSGKSRTSVTRMDPSSYPRPKAEKNAKIQTVAVEGSALKDMIDRCTFCVSSDQTRVILTGVLMETVSGELRLVALDGFRLSLQRDSGINPEDIRRTVPGRAVTEIGRLAATLGNGEKCELRFTDSHVTATVGGTTLTSTLLSGEYMDYAKIIPNTFKTSILVKREQLQAAVERTSVVAREGHNNLIRLDINDETLRISANADIGTVEEDVDILSDGEPLVIAFNAKYLTDVLKVCGGEDLIVSFNTAGSPCVITPKDHKSELYLILPVRVA